MPADPDHGKPVRLAEQVFGRERVEQLDRQRHLAESPGRYWSDVSFAPLPDVPRVNSLADVEWLARIIRLHAKILAPVLLEVLADDLADLLADLQRSHS